MYSTVRVMEHGGRLATLSECPIHLSSCDDADEEEEMLMMMIMMILVMTILIMIRGCS